jgi:hypothetical protein
MIDHMEAATEAAPLWNWLSITTLAIAAVGAICSILALWQSYRRDHPRVKWEARWDGPIFAGRDDYAPNVSLWIENRGAGLARDVHVFLAVDEHDFGGDGIDAVEFGKGIPFHFSLARDAHMRPHDGHFAHPGPAVAKSFRARIEWNQAPDLHRTRRKTFRRHFIPPPPPPRPQHPWSTPA